MAIVWKKPSPFEALKPPAVQEAIAPLPTHTRVTKYYVSLTPIQKAEAQGLSKMTEAEIQAHEADNGPSMSLDLAGRVWAVKGLQSIAKLSTRRLRK